MTHRFMYPAAVLIAACGGSDRTPPAAPPAETPASSPSPAAALGLPDVMVRGIVRVNPEMSYRPCDGGPIMALVDSTRDHLVPAFSSMRATDEGGMYVLGRGAHSPRGSLIFRDLQFATLPVAGEGCDQPAPGYTMAMRGISPPWRLVLTPGGFEYSDSTTTDPLRFPAVVPDDSAGLTRYQATLESGGSHTLHVLLSPTPCNEGGAFASMQVQLVVDGKARSGCGWRGTVP